MTGICMIFCCFQKNQITNHDQLSLDRLRRLGKILNKKVEDRTDEEKLFLDDNTCLISIVETRIVRQNKLKQRNEEIEDEMSVIDEKIEKLFDLIKQSEHIVVFTGAGISTSSNIPDYRGPNGEQLSDAFEWFYNSIYSIKRYLDSTTSKRINT